MEDQTTSPEINTVSRRGFVKAAAAVATTTALGGTVPQARASELPASQALEVDVVIIGGGLAGLSAAKDLVAGGKSVVVLEARDRVGGRAWTEQVPGGGWVDMGGQWVGPAQDRMQNLLAELDLETFPALKPGDAWFVFNGEQNRIPVSSMSSLDGVLKYLEALGETATLTVAEFLLAMETINEFSESVPRDNPGAAPRAKEWDQLTLYEWAKSQITPEIDSDLFLFLFRIVAQEWYAAEPWDVSFLHVLFYFHAAGGFERLEGDAIQQRVNGGVQQIGTKLAERLGIGSRVLLNTEVSKVSQTIDKVVVETNKGLFIGKRTIIAIPPTLSGRLNFDPALPAQRDQLVQRDAMPASIKCHAVYPTRFWAEQGLSGATLSDRVVSFTYDNSPPNNTPGILVAFIEADDARQWIDRSEEEIRNVVVEQLVLLFGEQARNPSYFYMGNWPAQKYTRGCYAGIMPPGVWSTLGLSLRKPFGLIHWAGTDTAEQWYAYMDGAIRSGERVAAEVIATLGSGGSGVASFFPNATFVSANWIYVPGLTNIFIQSFPWIYTQLMGWLYAGESKNTEFWFYHQQLSEWIYVKETEFPTFYSPSRESNILFTLEGNQRVYTVIKTGQRIVLPV